METQRSQHPGGFTALPSGTVLDRYRIDSVIAAGGFGISYVAYHTGLRKKYALKEHFPRQFAYRDGSTSEVRPTDPDTYSWALDRYVQEGQALARCHHPNVVSVADVFQANNTAYMVLGYEDGQSLKSWLDELRRTPTQAEIDSILWPLLDALEYVHGQGLLHRDIAPDNIIIRRDGTPCLIDFGAARQAVAQRSQLMSAVVKTGYSPPEQYSQSGRAQGPWSDIYALGATIYRALTGLTPQEAPDRQIDDKLGSVACVNLNAHGYRSHFLRAIDQALRLKPADRPQTVAEWRDALFEDTALVAANERSTRRVITRAEQARRPRSLSAQSRSLAAGAALIAFAFLAAGYFGWRNDTDVQGNQNSSTRTRESPAPDAGTAARSAEEQNARQEADELARRAIQQQRNLRDRIAEVRHSAEALAHQQHQADLAKGQVSPVEALAQILNGAKSDDPTCFQAPSNVPEIVVRACTLTIQRQITKMLKERALNRRGLAFFKLGRHLAALRDFDELTSLTATNAGYFDNRRAVNQALGRLDAALTDANKAVALAPSKAFSYHNRAAVLIEMKRYDAAITDLTKALELPDSFVYSQFDRGRAYAKNGQHDRAVADFSAVLARSADDKWALKERGFSYAALNNMRAAILDFEAFNSQEPEDSEVVKALALLRR